MVEGRIRRRQFLDGLGVLAIVGFGGCSGDGGGVGSTPTGKTGSSTSPGTTRSERSDDGPAETPTRSEISGDDPTGTPVTTVSDGEPVPGFPRDEDGFKTESIGSRAEVTDPDNNHSHELLVWNPTGSSRDIAVTIDRETRDGRRTVLEAVYEVPGDEHLTVVLLEPADYRVSLDGPAIDGTATISVPRSWFDCNESHHEITVTGTGDVVEVVYSTAVGCLTTTPVPTTSQRTPETR